MSIKFVDVEKERTKKEVLKDMSDLLYSIGNDIASYIEKNIGREKPTFLTQIFISFSQCGLFFKQLSESKTFETEEVIKSILQEVLENSNKLN